MKTLKHPKYRADIDGLRAIAVLAVIGFHAFPEWVKGGFIGVDIFFVISGYLISTIILENLQKKSFSFVEFYSRRIKRIFPSLLVVLIFCLTFGWFTLFADEYKQLGKHVAGGAGFVSNFLFWNESGYFDNAADTKPLLHLWSLGIEEQFYIVWPLFLWVAWRWQRLMLKILVIAATVSFALNISKISSDPVAMFYSPQTRFWELLLGSILSCATLSFRKYQAETDQESYNRLSNHLLEKASLRLNYQISSNLLSIVGASLIAVGLFIVNTERLFPGWWALLPTIGTALLVMAGPQAWLNQRILSNRSLVFVGLISYPLYLWHWPLLSFSRIIFSQSPPEGVKIFIILVSFILAWLTYKLIECPIRFGQAKRNKAALMAALMCFIGAVGFAGYKQEGMPFRAISYPATTYKGAEGHLLNECRISNEEHKKLFRVCNQDARQPPKYALIGDSKADAIYRGLIRTSTEDGRWFVIGGVGPEGALVPVLSEHKIYSSSQKPANIAINAVIRKKGIETVVFSTATRALFGLKNDYSIDDLPESKNYEAALTGLSNAAEKLINAEKKIVLMVDNPTLPDPRDCIVRKTSSEFLNTFLSESTNEHCQIELEHHLKLSKQYRDLLLEVQSRYPGSIKIFDTLEYLCDMKQGVCKSHKDGQPLYSYSDHVSDYAAGLIGKALNEFLSEERQANENELIEKS